VRCQIVGRRINRPSGAVQPKAQWFERGTHPSQVLDVAQLGLRNRKTSDLQEAEVRSSGSSSTAKTPTATPWAARRRASVSAMTMAGEPNVCPSA
jgi:hypothetical protein